MRLMAHTTLQGLLRPLARPLSRKRKGSSNRRKEALKLTRLHARIADNRTDALHTLTTNLTRRHTIGIEDLMRKLNERHGSYLAGRLLMNVRGMRANESLARSIADMNFFDFRKQLEFNSAMRVGRVVVVDRWYAGS